MDNNGQLKPGIFTSEFLTTVVTQVVGLLVLSGHLQAADATPTTNAIVALFVGAGMVYTSVMYIYSRFKLKQAIIAKMVLSVS